MNSIFFLKYHYSYKGTIMWLILLLTNRLKNNVIKFIRHITQAILRFFLTLLIIFYVCSSQAFADKPEWPTIAELLVNSLGNSDPILLSTVMSRCTALTMTLSSLASVVSPQMSSSYRNEANLFIGNALQIETALLENFEPTLINEDAISMLVVERVKAMVQSYQDWLDYNSVESGSYLDDEISLEVDSCHLAAKFASVSAGY